MMKVLSFAWQKSNEHMVSDLEIQPRPVEESIIDMCYSLIDLGIAKKDSWISWTSIKTIADGLNCIVIQCGK